MHGVPEVRVRGVHDECTVVSTQPVCISICLRTYMKSTQLFNIV